MNTCQLSVKLLHIVYMPYAIRKLPNQQRYRVYNKSTKRIYAYSAIRTNALKQLALLQRLHEH